jgi:hypothetical protein
MYHKDDDGTGDNRRLVLLAKQRSLPILLAASLTFNLFMDKLITKPVSEPGYDSTKRTKSMSNHTLRFGPFQTQLRELGW